MLKNSRLWQLSPGKASKSNITLLFLIPMVIGNSILIHSSLAQRTNQETTFYRPPNPPGQEGYVHFLWRKEKNQETSFYRPPNPPGQEGFEPLFKLLANRWQDA